MSNNEQHYYWNNKVVRIVKVHSSCGDVYELTVSPIDDANHTISIRSHDISNFLKRKV